MKNSTYWKVIIILLGIVAIGSLLIHYKIIEPPVKISGTYMCEGCMFDKVVFKGNSTSIIYTLSIPFATSYEIDQRYIHIKGDSQDFLFTIVSQDTLVGTGLASGIYVRK